VLEVPALLKTLVTGGTGFVGSRLVRRLLAAGRDVRVLARASSPLGALSGLDVEVVRGDILLTDTAYRALRGCDRLFHVAAVYVVWARDPQDILRPAVEGTRSVLGAAVRSGGLERIVVTSSAAPSVGVSDSPDQIRDEGHSFNLEGAETYVVAKNRAEKVALEMQREHGLPLSVACPAGIFGPGDHKPTPSGENVVRFLVGLPLVGFPVYPAGGLAIADVDDVADGHLAIEAHGRPGEKYLVAGENLTYRRMFEILAELTGLPAPRREVGRVASMAGGLLAEAGARLFGLPPLATYRYARDLVGRYMYYSSAKAQADLGWTHRPARDALARSVAWYLAAGRVPPSRRRTLRLAPAVENA